jgi:uncharacterized membrane protein HdeD (DUF308 family)
MANLEDPTRYGFLNVGPHWGALLALGILLIILGFVGLGMVAGITIVSIIFFGVLLIIGGIAHFIYVFKDKRWKGIVWHIIVAIFYIIAGVAIILDPILASAIITAFLAGVFIVIGVTRLVMAFSFKRASGWGWLLFAGICGIALGIIILSQWPISALWFIGLFIAIEIIVTGWSYVFIALALRSGKKAQ